MAYAEAQGSELKGKTCASCGGPLSEADTKCSMCGALVGGAPAKPVQALAPMDADLRNYLANAYGITRVGLNVCCAIGVFIFGWLVAVPFSLMGKSKTGWTYLIPIIVCFGLARNGEHVLALVAILIYVVAWVHANIVLSGYQSAARRRLSQIRVAGAADVETTLEHGLLLYKLLDRKSSGITTLRSALEMQGGRADLLNAAGLAMLAQKHPDSAKQFFTRALKSRPDSALAQRLGKSIAKAEKALARAR